MALTSTEADQAVTALEEVHPWGESTARRERTVRALLTKWYRLQKGAPAAVFMASAEELRTNYSFGSSCDSSENVSKSSKHLQMERVTAVAQTESSHTSNSPGKTSDDNGSEQNERSTSASSGNNDDNAVSHSFTLRGRSTHEPSESVEDTQRKPHYSTGSSNVEIGQSREAILLQDDGHPKLPINPRDLGDASVSTKVLDVVTSNQTNIATPVGSQSAPRGGISIGRDLRESPHPPADRPFNEERVVRNTPLYRANSALSLTDELCAAKRKSGIQPPTYPNVILWSDASTIGLGAVFEDSLETHVISAPMAGITPQRMCTAELLAGLTGALHFREKLKSNFTWAVDNTAACRALARGHSGSKSADSIILEWIRSAPLPQQMLVVPSQCQLADEPSRACHLTRKRCGHAHPVVVRRFEV